MPADEFTVYDITMDERRPLRQSDLDMLQNVYTAYGMQREAERALATLTLAVGQGKVASSEAWEVLRPLTDWAKQ